MGRRRREVVKGDEVKRAAVKASVCTTCESVARGLRQGKQKVSLLQGSLLGRGAEGGGCEMGG
jgi:hypothetical protein